MLGLISLMFFARTGHIDAFRSIVGDGCGGEKFLGFALPLASRTSITLEKYALDIGTRKER
jgi:hypothetical protein